MGDHPAEVKTGSSTTKHPQNDNAGPIIEETQESEEYQQDLQVVLGTAFGVIAVVGLIALGFLLYRIYKSRQAALSFTQNETFDTFERNVTVGIDGKSQPVVLLLYAYDCSVHQQVVGALAGFLMEACGVTVSIDLWEEQDIAEKGIDDWLVDRLQDADFIMVLCSVGARLRCSKKGMRFKADCHQFLPDYFAVAVDYVAEKMRAERQKGLSLNKFIMVYMDYSTSSDIPPQLDTATQFCLMRDVHKLYLYLHAQRPEALKMNAESEYSICEGHYHETETGAILKVTLEQAKIFFNENPSWMDDRLEPERCPGFLRKGAKSRKHRRTSMEHPLLALTQSPPLMLHEDNSVNNLGLGEHYPRKSENDTLLKHDGNDLERISKICNTLPRMQGPREVGQTSFCLFQNRQNSLPSSLASSCLAVPFARHALSKSMDSFAVDSSIHPDGLPCLFCNGLHMEAMADCRLMEQYMHPSHGKCRQQSKELSQSMLHLNHAEHWSSRSQTTVLHAEVHQEWGQSSRGTPEKKCSTFGCDPRLWNSEFTATIAPYQSLPPHLSPSHNGVPSTDWDKAVYHWGSRPEEIGLRSLKGSNCRLSRSDLTNSSLSADDSSSCSDGDSLERDLRSIHNISSFQEFKNFPSLVGSFGFSRSPYDLSPVYSLEMNTIFKPASSKPSESMHFGSNC